MLNYIFLNFQIIANNLTSLSYLFYQLRSQIYCLIESEHQTWKYLKLNVFDAIQFPKDRPISVQNPAYKHQLIDRSQRRYHLNLFPWLGRCVFHVSSPSWALLWACCDSRRRVSLAAICICTLVSLIGCCLFACAFAYWVCVCFMSGRRRWRWRRRSMNSQTRKLCDWKPWDKSLQTIAGKLFPFFQLLSFLEFVANYPPDGQWFSDGTMEKGFIEFYLLFSSFFFNFNNITISIRFT